MEIPACQIACAKANPGARDCAVSGTHQIATPNPRSTVQDLSRCSKPARLSWRFRHLPNPRWPESQGVNLTSQDAILMREAQINIDSSLMTQTRSVRPNQNLRLRQTSVTTYEHRIDSAEQCHKSSLARDRPEGQLHLFTATETSIPVCLS